jgi:hypothetical protein
MSSVKNGLYSIKIEMKDGARGRASGVIVLLDGKILGGDPHFSGVRSIRRIVELRLIRDSAAPGLPTAKLRRAVGFPKHRRGPVHGRAHEVPLLATEMPGARDEDDPLIEVAKLNPKPAFVLAAHIGANHGGGDVTPI